jgi:hypothetical protein
VSVVAVQASIAIRAVSYQDISCYCCLLQTNPLNFAGFHPCHVFLNNTQLVMVVLNFFHVSVDVARIVSRYKLRDAHRHVAQPVEAVISLTTTMT